MSPAPIIPGLGDPSLRALEQLSNALQQGPLADLFAGFGTEASQKARGILMMALLNGDNPTWDKDGPSIANALQQALNTSLYRAQTIARTEMLNAYRDSNLANYQANSDVVDGWIWTADLSSRSCCACISMNGTLHSLDETMDEHVCGRCSPIPHTKSWSDILNNAGYDTSGLDLPDSAPSIPSGADWFAAQSADVQQQVLGKAGYALYQSGTPLADFVGIRQNAQYGPSIYVKSIKELQGG